MESDQGVSETLATVNDIILAGDGYGGGTEGFRHELNDDQLEFGNMDNPAAFDILNAVSTTDAIFCNSLPSIEWLLKSSNLEKEKIEDLILVGTSNHIAKLQSLLEEYLGVNASNGSAPPDSHAVAATKIARILSSEEINEWVSWFIEVTSLSLGIETSGGIIKTIIRRNTPIPTRKSRIFSTATNNQTSISDPDMVELLVLQAEDHHEGDAALRHLLPETNSVL
ncbi:glucose-regulated protein [Ilyonectria robusta]